MTIENDSTRKRAHILETAVDQARIHGYDKITRDGVAAAAGVGDGVVNHHYGTMANLKRAVLDYAVKNEILEIIAQGVAAKDIDGISPALRSRALATLI